MYKKVEEDPTRSVLEIYEEVRNGFTEGMNQSAMQSFLQEFPTWRSMQSQLYKKRREYIPDNPIDMKDMETDSEWFNYNKQTLESIVKGDALLEDGRRVVLMSTDDHLDLMARAPQLLGDGTFRVTPSQWLQTFIISAHIFGAIFVPVCFVLLPDKKRETYDLMFSLLKDALSVRGLELSASNFMSDFEVAIRDSFTEHFPGISPKGCQFHFSKAIISKVSKSGFKSDYSNKSCLKFSSFIRSIIGLAFVPLDRFSEGVKYQPLYLFAFSESDFNPAHYQSIRPNTDQNVVLTYWRENQDTIDESRTPVLQESCFESRLELSDGSLTSELPN